MLAFPASDKLSSLAKRSALQEARGWIVRGTEVGDWRFSGYLRRGDHLLVTGPCVDGELLAAALERRGAVALAAVARVAAALRLLVREHGFDQPLHSRRVPAGRRRGAHLSSRGGQAAYRNPLARGQLAAAARLNHPDLAAAERLGVTLAILSYRAVTGVYPFSAAREDDLRNQMRRLDVVPARLRVPGTDPELSALMERALRPERQQPRPGLDEWVAALERVTHEPGTGAGGRGHRRCAAGAGPGAADEYEQTFRRRVFLQRNLRTIVVVAVVAAAVAGSSAPSSPTSSSPA